MTTSEATSIFGRRADSMGSSSALSLEGLLRIYVRRDPFDSKSTVFWNSCQAGRTGCAELYLVAGGCCAGGRMHDVLGDGCCSLGCCAAGAAGHAGSKRGDEHGSAPTVTEAD